MKKVVLALALVAGATVAVRSAIADNSPELNPLPRHMPTQERFAKAKTQASGNNLVYHGGPTITAAHVVAIFWGPSFNQAGSADNTVAQTLTKYIANFGTTGEYNVITQYYSGTPATYIQTSNLATDNPAVWYDTSTPPTNVTDATVQAEVMKYVNTYGFDSSAIYEVFLPSTSYSSDGTSTSCGGTNLQYCAYHGNFASGNRDVKYASMPYPSCGGCQTSGFSVAQNFEHFVSHETREAVTDSDLNAWYDRRGNEADDKCAWSPTPFIDASTGFAYQYEWSNANGGCVQTR